MKIILNKNKLKKVGNKIKNIEKIHRSSTEIKSVKVPYLVDIYEDDEGNIYDIEVGEATKSNDPNNWMNNIKY